MSFKPYHQDGYLYMTTTANKPITIDYERVVGYSIDPRQKLVILHTDDDNEHYCQCEPALALKLSREARKYLRRKNNVKSK